MNAYNFALLFFSFCAFFISLLIWLKRNDAIGRIYFFFSMTAVCWGAAFSVMISDNVAYETALLACRISQISALFIAPTWVHFVLVFTNRFNRYMKLLKVNYVISIGLSFFGFSDWFVPSVRSIAGFMHMTQPGPLYHVFAIAFFLMIPFGFVQLLKQLKVSKGTDRWQLQGLMLATFAGFQGGALAFFPVYEIPVPQYGLLLMPLYPFAMAYFMMKRGLFDEFEMVQAAHRDKLAAIGTLATSMNHEVRNPLYIIQGTAISHLTNLEDGIYKNKDQIIEKSTELFKKTRDQATRAMEIMKSFSMFAKQKVKQEPEFSKVNLGKVFDDILPLVRHELELDKIEFVRNISEKTPLISADRRHIEEILFNLIVNACQSMKQEEVSGEIRVSTSQNNGKVELEVEDSGPGIPEEQLSHIFQPFYTTKKDGTGLGLYVIKQLTERNCGKISVKSKVGEGTKFLLEFKI